MEHSKLHKVDASFDIMCYGGWIGNWACLLSVVWELGRGRRLTMTQGPIQSVNQTKHLRVVILFQSAHIQFFILVMKLDSITKAQLSHEWSHHVFLWNVSDLALFYYFYWKISNGSSQNYSLRISLFTSPCHLTCFLEAPGIFVYIFYFVSLTLLWNQFSSGNK